MNTSTDISKENFHTFFNELNGESDRGCAIVGAAILDDLLGQLLGQYLVENKDPKNDILNSKDFNAPLGSFGSRMSVAYAVGLISKSDLETLRMIKGIRNDFAHNLGITFDEKGIASRCNVYTNWLMLPFIQRRIHLPGKFIRWLYHFSMEH